MLLVARGVFVNPVSFCWAKVGKAKLVANPIRVSRKRIFIVRFPCFGDDLSLTLCGQFWRFSSETGKTECTGMAADAF